MTRGVFVVRALIAGLCLAAATAIAALLVGEFSDLHARIVGTALAFSFFCALGASGDALRAQATGALASAGAGGTVLSAAAFVALLPVIWTDLSDREWPWQVWGVLAVLALWASHWSLVLRLRRDEDSPAVRAVWRASIAAATVVTLLSTFEIATLADVGEWFPRGLGVLLVLAVLTTALPPIMRRLAAPVPAGGLARELSAAAERVERIDSPEDARREAEALRRLAERARG